jgi:hypothetical protein
MNRYKPIGWQRESHRHSLAAKGIKTRFISYASVSEIVESRRIRHPTKVFSDTGIKISDIPLNKQEEKEVAFEKVKESFDVRRRRRQAIKEAIDVVRPPVDGEKYSHYLFEVKNELRIAGIDLSEHVDDTNVPLVGEKQDRTADRFISDIMRDNYTINGIKPEGSFSYDSANKVFISGQKYSLMQKKKERDNAIAELDKFGKQDKKDFKEVDDPFLLV